VRGPEGGEGKGDRCIAPPIIFRKGKNERCVKTGKKSEGARARTHVLGGEGGKGRRREESESNEKGGRLRAPKSGGESRRKRGGILRRKVMGIP
jgi:hypothetical protein